MELHQVHLEKIVPRDLPSHVAIIMDGNGRWAQKRALPRYVGHNKGVESVKAVVEAAHTIHLNQLTLFAFSEENWKRSPYEVTMIFSLINKFIFKEKSELYKRNIKVRVLGNKERLPKRTQLLIKNLEKDLSDNTGLHLNIALSYSARDEIMKACQQIARQVSEKTLSWEKINSLTIAKHLQTAGIPDPDLLIRTSGEQRISNFLLWQIAYTELYFDQTLWPDFRQKNFYRALNDYANRQRRFGRENVSESESSCFSASSKEHFPFLS